MTRFKVFGISVFALIISLTSGQAALAAEKLTKIADETTICDPATTSHAKLSEETRKRLSISDNLLRLSVGIENKDDLIGDIREALNY